MHLSCLRKVLEERFPPLEVSSDEGLDDSPEQMATAQNAVLQYGLGIARRIDEDAKRYGRRRRATTTPVTPTASRNTTPTTPDNGREPAGRPAVPRTTTTTQVDNPGAQTTDGLGSVRSRGQPRLLQCRSQSTVQQQCRRSVQPV